MPRIARTILPRIRKSIDERGVVVTLARSVLLPWHLVRELRAARALRRTSGKNGSSISEFDLAHGVDTEGEFDGWTYLSDLEIASPNWIHGKDYAAVEPERFHVAMQAVDAAVSRRDDGRAGASQMAGTRWGDLTFIDFGSGMGRALLLASEYPFQKIVGLEFSRELHDAAVENVRKYRSTSQKCSAIEPLVIDFVDYEFPAESLVLFFFDPCDETVLKNVMKNLERSLDEHAREVYVVYIGPRGMELGKLTTFLAPVVINKTWHLAVYEVR